MQQYWEQMISKSPDRFDLPGKGYMVHPEWFYHEEWFTRREMSFNFGWDNYKPE